LNKLQSEISKTLEKVGSREKYINSQLGGLVEEYRAAQDTLAAINDK
jgi:estrogen-related receptor beta like 1